MPLKIEIRQLSAAVAEAAVPVTVIFTRWLALVGVIVAVKFVV